MTVPAFRAAGIAGGIARGSWVAAAGRAKTHISGPAPLGKVGVLDRERLARANAGDAAALAEIEKRLLDSTSGSLCSEYQRPSMAQDMAKRRRTEIEFMNGFIAEKGAEAGVPAPTNARLTEVVKQVEHGELPARPENVLWN